MNTTATSADCHGRSPKRIFVDASHTLPSGLNSGVQRVVRNVSKQIPELFGSAAVVVTDGDSFRSVVVTEVMTARQKIDALRGNVLEHMPKSYVSLASLACKLMPLKQLRKWLLPLPGHQGIFKVPLKVYERMTVPRSDTSESQLTIGAGDLLVLPDAYWAHSEVWEAASRARAAGAVVASVVYDLIPLTHPQFVADGAHASFREYLYQVARHSDLIIAISDTVRNEVAQALPKLWPDEKLCSDLRSFELGAQFQEHAGFVREEVSKLFSEDGVDNPYLMVATFDPRKNHHYVLDAFEKIWEASPNQKLCFVGRVGWLCNDVIERIWAHPKFGDSLFALHDVSDAELSYCYQKARAVIFPSIVEGFGLPIVEALWYGKHVFASDTPIHREVGKDECLYCDLGESSSLAEQIMAWESEHGAESPVKESSIRPVDWRQSSQLLLDHCLNAFAANAGDRSVKAAA